MKFKFLEKYALYGIICVWKCVLKQKAVYRSKIATNWLSFARLCNSYSSKNGLKIRAGLLSSAMAMGF